MNAPAQLRADAAAPASGAAPMPAYTYRVRRHGDLRCPHCRMPMERRSSQEVAITLREIFFACPNAACGHTCKASLTYDYGLSPSAIPDPSVNLPMRPLPREAVVRAIADALAAEPDPAQPGLFDP